MQGEDEDRADVVGRVERLLYDGRGRLEGFELATREGLVLVGARASHVERIALRACRHGLGVRVWFDHEAREPGRQLARIAIRVNGEIPDAAV